MTMKKAVAYLRVSTDSQADGYGLEAQLHDVTEYAKAHNIEIVEVFREEGVSGTTDSEDREAFVMMEDYLKAHPEIKCVIIPRLDRLARKMEIQEKIISDFRRRGIEPISVKEPDLDSDDPYRKLMRRMIGLFNEFERELIDARLKAGRKVKARKGGHATGRVPTGYKVVIEDGKKTVQKSEEEIKVVRLIFELRDKKKMSYREIAAYLNKKGYKPKQAEKFGPTSVRNIYVNPKYRGVLKYKVAGETIVAQNEEFRVI